MEVPVVSPLRKKPQPAILGVTDTETPLSLTLQINVVKSQRTRCPSCGQRRVLFRIAAFAKEQPVGVGDGKCATCAGFREPDVARNARRTR